MRERESRRKTLAPVPQFIKVAGADTAQQRENIEHFLAPLAGKPLNLQKLDQALTRLTGLGVMTQRAFSMSRRTEKKACGSR